VSVDDIPARHPDEAADVIEAADPVKLRCTDGVLVAHALRLGPSVLEVKMDFLEDATGEASASKRRSRLSK